MFHQVGKQESLHIGFLTHVVTDVLDNLNERFGIQSARRWVNRISVDQLRIFPSLGELSLGQELVAIGA